MLLLLRYYPFAVLPLSLVFRSVVVLLGRVEATFFDCFFCHFFRKIKKKTKKKQ